MNNDIKLDYGLILAVIFFFIVIMILTSGISLKLNLINSYQVYELNKPVEGATNLVFIIVTIIIFFSILKHVFHHHEKKYKK